MKEKTVIIEVMWCLGIEVSARKRGDQVEVVRINSYHGLPAVADDLAGQLDDKAIETLDAAFRD